LQRQPFFIENGWNVTVWLGCEQRAAIFGNYWLFIVFSGIKKQKKRTPEGPFSNAYL
jgi:hypothetical protein